MASSVDVTMSQSTADYALVQTSRPVLKRSAPPLCSQASTVNKCFKTACLIA